MNIAEINEIIDRHIDQFPKKSTAKDLTEAILEEALIRSRQKNEQNIQDLTLILVLFNQKSEK